MAAPLFLRDISRSGLARPPQTLGWKCGNARMLGSISYHKKRWPISARSSCTSSTSRPTPTIRVPTHGSRHSQSWRGRGQSLTTTNLPIPAHTNLTSIRTSSSSPPHHPPQTSTTTQPPPPRTSNHPPYTPPTTGLLSYLPPSWVPYAELIRLDKPTGTYYLFFPCLFSTLLAAPLTTPITPPITLIHTTLLFLTGALIMRGAGCTINDLWDRNLDPHVTRTRLRPLARGAINPRSALIFTSAQLLTGLALLLQFPSSCLPYAVPSLILVATYPLAKRITHYPQFILGLTFSWGAIMGFPALGIDILSSAPALTAASCLYASCVSWTVLYDMIYAHMDIRDDGAAGIKSIALRHAEDTKLVLSGLAVLQVGLLAAAGMVVGAGPVFFVGGCGGAAGTLGLMVWRVKLGDVRDCWWWFRWGCWFTGGAVVVGLGGEYVMRLEGWYGDERGGEMRERAMVQQV
ncbi:MAG: Para-hydroxybenzoate--polyprenyltransferase, mitochondrial precursor (PHB:polyprenyltransferase) [Pleopsidium flavum]|nr:MAG: Para-hydroxybenzoate--polyprenyltransferase, mitochondrial precursor (PHB:polyprenyltransferase) [Pleopsidium flavum]